MKQMRNSNFEILRIISMIMIIAHHYVVRGLTTIELEYSFNRYIAGFLSLGGKLGVTVFILISGYFMVDSKFTLSKLLKLIGEVWFYSVSIGLLFIFVLPTSTPIGLKSCIKMCFPIAYDAYWFMTAYVILMCISPLLNIIISNIDETMHKKILLVATMILYVVPTILPRAHYGLSVNFGQCVIIYMYAGYIKKYVDMTNKGWKKHLLMAIVLYLIVVFSNVLLIFLGNYLEVGIFTQNSEHLAKLYSPFILIAGIELFIAFAKMKAYQNRVINVLANATLGIYLIHDNNLFREYLWGMLCKNPEWYASKYMLLHAIISILAVYVVCTIIDLLRQATVEKIYLSIINKLLEMRR